MTDKILVSACLLGHLVRYDGAVVPALSFLKELEKQGIAVPFCPEAAGGLPIPRPPAEIEGGDGADVLAGRVKVQRKDGVDVTENFLRGAEKAARCVTDMNIRYAVMKDGSPSCGSSRIYDGSFSKVRVKGKGVTAALLEKRGVRVFTENDMEALSDLVQSLPSFSPEY